MSDLSILWLLVVTGGPLLLAAALAFGVWQWRHRRRANDQARDQAIRDAYSEKR